MKIAYNNCFGGFNLSEKAVRLGRELSGDPNWGGPCLVGDHYEDTGERVEKFYGGARDIERHDPILIAVIERLGCEASGDCANLAIRDVPAGTAYRIDEYDGSESVLTVEDYEWSIAG